MFASAEASSSGHWPWRDGYDRQATRSRRHARPVSGTANARTLAQPRGFAGVATASRSGFRSDAACPIQLPVHDAEGVGFFV